MFSIEGVLGKVSDIFNPISKIVDNVHTSEEEKLTLRNNLVSLQNEVAKGQMQLMSRAMDLESEALKAQQVVLTAEAGSSSWLAANWRPLTMITFVAITSLHSLGFIDMDPQTSNNYFELVKIGLGGYVIGRSFEKAGPSIANIIKK